MPSWIALYLAKLQSLSVHQHSLLKNRFIPRTRGRARMRTARDFLKAIVAMLELETNDALISKRRFGVASFKPFL